MHEVVHKGQARGLTEPATKALLGHAGHIGDLAEGDGALVVVLNVFRNALHALADFLAHHIGIGAVGRDGIEFRSLGNHSHEVEEGADASERVIADDGFEGVVFFLVEYAQVNAKTHGVEEASQGGTFFEGIEPLLRELEPPTFLFHHHIFLVCADEVVGKVRTQKEGHSRAELYGFVADEGDAFAFDDVGDFDFRVVVPVVVENALLEDIAVIATVLFGNADIFNSGFHATIVLIFGLPRAHIRSPPAQTHW